MIITQETETCLDYHLQPKIGVNTENRKIGIIYTNTLEIHLTLSILSVAFLAPFLFNAFCISIINSFLSIFNLVQIYIFISRYL